LVRSPDVAKISFTGSVAVGQSIMRDGAATMKRVTLELGGKSPTILLDDADLKKAIPSAFIIGFLNNGQAWVAGTRLLVPKSRFDEVKQAIVDTIPAFPVGDPADPKTAVGPMVNQKQYERVEAYIRKGIEEGADVLVGGEGHPPGLESGYFVKPTVFVNVKNDMTIAQEEIFGPVLSVITYEDEEDAIRIANDTEYGLHAYVSGTDIQRARRVASRILAGRVAINGMLDDQQAPFGGSSTPASAVNSERSGSRHFLNRGPSLSDPLFAFTQVKLRKANHDQTRQHFPRRSGGSPRDPRTRRGLRTLRRSSRCKRSNGSLHPGRSFRGVHERQCSDALTGTALARGTRSRFRRPEQVRRDHALSWTDDDRNADPRQWHRRNLLHAPSLYQWQSPKPDDCRSPLCGHLRKDGRRLAVCGTQALRRLA